jgi:pimeloyl-ACP methyl ester carboxylesterase
MSIDVRTLRRHLPQQVVLVHGLFSNGAYWLPWLEHFASYQVTLVGIDYAALVDAGAAPDQIAARVDALVGDKPGHLIAHSFGCWPGAASNRDGLSRTFICPTFAALDFDAQGFCAEVARRIGATTPEQQAAIARQLDQVIAYKDEHAAALRLRDADAFYLPTDDPYFRYTERMRQGRTHACEGGHFDAGPALAAIAARLGSSV